MTVLARLNFSDFPYSGKKQVFLQLIANGQKKGGKRWRWGKRPAI